MNIIDDSNDYDKSYSNSGSPIKIQDKNQKSLYIVMEYAEQGDL